MQTNSHNEGLLSTRSGRSLSALDAFRTLGALKAPSKLRSALALDRP
jgi:hypothetical protein